MRKKYARPFLVCLFCDEIVRPDERNSLLVFPKSDQPYRIIVDSPISVWRSPSCRNLIIKCPNW